LYHRGYDLLVAAHGEANGAAAVLLQNIGAVHDRARRYRDAKDAYEQALPLLRRNFGEQDHHVGTVLGNLAQLYQILGDYPRAFDAAQRGLEIDTAVSGPDHPDVGIAWLQLARISDKLGDQRLALEQIDRAGAIFGQRLPQAHTLRLYAAYFKAGFLIELGLLGDARTPSNSSPPPKPRASASGSVNGWVRLAEIERLNGQALKSRELAGERVLADPAARGDRRLEADARWARAYALAMQAQMEEAEAERMRALRRRVRPGAGPRFSKRVRGREYYVCARDAVRAITILATPSHRGSTTRASCTILPLRRYAPVRISRPSPRPLRRAPGPARLPRLGRVRPEIDWPLATMSGWRAIPRHTEWRQTRSSHAARRLPVHSRKKGTRDDGYQSGRHYRRRADLPEQEGRGCDHGRDSGRR
jgi:tetratricopeptide (TPR) repeat protein